MKISIMFKGGLAGSGIEVESREELENALKERAWLVPAEEFRNLIFMLVETPAPSVLATLVWGVHEVAFYFQHGEMTCELRGVRVDNVEVLKSSLGEALQKLGRRLQGAATSAWYGAGSLVGANCFPGAVEGLG